MHHVVLMLTTQTNLTIILKNSSSHHTYNVNINFDVSKFYLLTTHTTCLLVDCCITVFSYNEIS